MFARSASSTVPAPTLPSRELVSSRNPKRVPQPHSQPLRIVYVDGPGDVLGTFQRWQGGDHDSNEVSLAFSEEFFSLIQDLGAKAFVIATHDRTGQVEQGDYIVVHHPLQSRHRRGFAYHAGEVRFALWLVYTALRFRADVLIVADRVHWFALWPARLLGIRIIAMLHCALWPKGSPRRSLGSRMANALNRFFWNHVVSSTLCVSPEVERQYSSVMHISRAVHQVRPQYFQEVFEAIPAPAPIGETLHVFFAGRMERGKGIFDLLEIARRLSVLRPGEFRFELAGLGPAFDELQAQVDALGLGESFCLLGKLDMAAMALAYGRSQAVIVPTNTGFAEGMNRVCIEAILAHRPLITSPASHVSDVLTDALVEVAVGDLEAYCRALISIKDDPILYQRLCTATLRYSAPFYDRAQGYRSSLHRAILGLEPAAALPRPA